MAMKTLPFLKNGCGRSQLQYQRLLIALMKPRIFQFFFRVFTLYWEAMALAL